MKNRILGLLTALAVVCGFFGLPARELLGTYSLTASAAGLSIIDDYSSKYYYSGLTDSAKGCYAAILKAVQNRETEIDISEYALDNNDIQQVMLALKYENPQLFYIDAAASGMVNFYTDNWTSIRPNYIRTASQIESISSKLEKAAEPIIEEALGYSDTFERLKVLHDAIINMTTYSLTGDASISEADGVLLNGKALCEGYSKAFAYLCQSIGIPCICVIGTANGGAHMWNMVQVGGEWYHVDTTWDDPVAAAPMLRYDYFCVSTATISADHYISSYLPVPAAASDYDGTQTDAAPEKDSADISDISDSASDTVTIDDKFSWILGENCGNISQSSKLFSYITGISDKIIEAVGGTLQAEFDLGELGTAAQLAFNAGVYEHGQYASLLRCNPQTGNAEFVSCAKIDSTGCAELNVSEAGTYFIVIDNEAKMPGDLNNELRVNALDAAEILKNLVNGAAMDIFKCDYNNDGCANAFDASAILRSVVA